MLISKKPIFFPAIDDYNRLQAETGMTHEFFLDISQKYKSDTGLYDWKKMYLPKQLEALKQCCKNDLQYFTMLLLIGMDTQAYISNGNLEIDKPVFFPG